MTAVLQNDSGLLLVERDLLLGLVDLAVFLECEPLDMFAVHDGLFYDLLAVLDFYLRVEPALRLDAHQRASFAEAVAAALLEGYAFGFRLVLKLHRAVYTLRLDKLAEPCVDVQRAAGNAAGARTDEYLSLVCIVSSDAFLTERPEFLSVL